MGRVRRVQNCSLAVACDDLRPGRVLSDLTNAQRWRVDGPKAVGFSWVAKTIVNRCTAHLSRGECVNYPASELGTIFRQSYAFGGRSCR